MESNVYKLSKRCIKINFNDCVCIDIGHYIRILEGLKLVRKYFLISGDITESKSCKAD